MAPIPAVGGSASATVPNTAANAIGSMQGGDPAGDQIQQLAEQIREASGVIDEIGSANPTLSAEVAQIKQTLRSMLVKAASAASAQTPASLSVPMGQ